MNFTENDQRNIKNIRDRIDLANAWVDEIYNIVNSDKQLSRSELIALKGKARQYKNHIELMTDPIHRIFLHLQENQELSNRLENLLVAAITRLNTNIDVIEGFILTNKDNVKGLTLPERALISVYEGKIINRGHELYEDFLYYSIRANRIGTESDKYGRFSQRKTSNKINRINKIISSLSSSVQQIAIDELNTLKAVLNKELSEK